MRQSNLRNTNDRDQTPAQKTKKVGQRKNNHRKNKVTMKQKDACLNNRKHNHQRTKHTQRKTLSKLGVANLAKGRATRDVINDERCNEMREQSDKKRQNEINKPWSHPRAMEKSVEVRSPKIRS
ncbi:hypothetical protein YC2023_010368 [Brassica napus]